MANGSLPPLEYPDDRQVLVDRRASPRFHTVCFDVTIERRGGMTLYRARNISDEGVMVHAHEPLAIGDMVVVGLSERHHVRGTVVWQNER